MSFAGLDLRIDEDNIVIIDESCNFQTSRIHVKGKGNKITIKKALLYKSLFININGNNKNIIIEETKKNINQLKIVSIRGENQSVTIGKGFSCGGCEIQMNDGHESLEIGDDCLFSWGIKMRTSDGHSIVDNETGLAINLPKDIYIGNHVWIGEDVKLLKGVRIPSNCVVGSSAVVTKCFEEEFTVIAGFPAKVVKTGVNWDREMPYRYNEKLQNKKNKEVIIHIGSGKTGSTSIQKALIKSRKEFKSILNYPRLLNTKDNQIFRFAFCNLENTPSNIRVNFRDNINGFKKYQEDIKSSFTKAVQGSNNVLISSEFLFLSKKNEIKVIKEFLEDQGFNNVKIVLYVRDPKDYYLSVAQQALKTSCKLPSPKDFYYNFMLAIENWTNIFGSIIVRPFSRELLKNQNVVCDFQGLLDEFGYPLKLDSSKRMNESISAEASQAMQNVFENIETLSLSPEKYNLIRNEIALFIKDYSEIGTKSRLKLCYSDVISSRFKKDIEYLNEKYGFNFKVTSNVQEFLEPQKFRDIVDSFDEELFNKMYQDLLSRVGNIN